MISVNPHNLVLPWLLRSLRGGACALSVLLVVPSLTTGCSSSTHIEEAALSITPTEPSSSFSKVAQAQIATIGLTSDALAAPEHLEENESLKTINPAQRSLVLAEAWYLRGQNDLDVPIAVSLHRFLRAAHFAYDGIFAGPLCASSAEEVCSQLFNSYNRAAREVARLTHNGRALPEPREGNYVVDLEADHDPLELNEWDILLDEVTSSPATQHLGVSGSACHLVASGDNSESARLRLCAPIAFLVTFEARSDDAISRAHISAHKSDGHEGLVLHGREVTLANDPLAAWIQIFSSQAVTAPTTSCLADVTPLLPTVFILPQASADTSTSNPDEWPAIASLLSSDSDLRDHYNFCITTPPQAQLEAPSSDLFIAPLSPLAQAPQTSLHVVLIAQGGANDAFVKGLKQSLKDRSTSASTRLVVAGSLTIPERPQPRPNHTVLEASDPSTLSRAAQSALNDSRRLLTRLANAEDGVFANTTRSSNTPQPGMNLSPVM